MSEMRMGSNRVTYAWLGWLGVGLTLVAAAAAETGADVRRDAVVEVVERVMPSVVNVQTEEIIEYRDPFESIFREFWGPYYRRRPQQTRYSLGSGVIIDEDGYILTNMHVVQRATRVWVQLADGREFEARPGIVGTARTDVALLQIVSDGAEKFRAIPFARDDDLLLGETVLALGNPFGLGGSVSRGILSSKNRRPAREDEPLGIGDWLQTDAAINPGSSGGPLVNLRGELIGLNVAVHAEGQGIGFAIPVRQVAEALSDIFTPEVHRSLWFGARIRSGSYPLEVMAVDPGSPAETAGLRVGDQIETVNGRSPRGFVRCIEAISDSPGRQAKLGLRREGKKRTAEVTLKSLADLVRHRVGLTVQELTGDLAEGFNYAVGSGLLIADVEPDGPAAKADLRPGYLVVGMDGRATGDLLNAAVVLGGKKPGDTVELSIAAWQRRGLFPAQLVQGRITLRVR